MIRRRWLSVSLLALSSAACFHQVVNTGRTPGTTVVEKPFVATWIFGLVAAPEIDVRKECPSGVAIVQTEQSLVNGIVSIITFGIFTPQHVTVTCASGTASLPSAAPVIRIPATATPQERAALLNDAVEQSIASHAAVVLRS